MNTTLCYRCEDGLALFGPLDHKFKDSEGNKPCAECLLDMQIEVESQEESDDCVK